MPTSSASPASCSVLLLGLLAVGCRSNQAATDPIPLEFIHDTITSLQTDAEGVTWIGFGAGARAFAILPADRDMLNLAKDAQARGVRLHATVRAGHPNKTPAAMEEPIDSSRIAVVRLAADPDPRRP